MDLKKYIRSVKDYPKKGILFRDITTLIKDPKAFNYAIDKILEISKKVEFDKVSAIESRGFIFGAVLARDLGLPFVLIRKKGKLPSETVSQGYELEYGTDTIEVHKDAINEGDNVLIVDDLLATGGTMKAACLLVEKLQGKVVSCAFVVDLPDLKGSEKLSNYDLFKLVEFEGD